MGVGSDFCVLRWEDGVVAEWRGARGLSERDVDGHRSCECTWEGCAVDV